MRWIGTLVIALGAMWLGGCGAVGVATGPGGGVVGKWRSADGSYVVEFLANGDCSAKMRIQGHEVGGACTYTADAENIVIHYKGMSTNPQQAAPNAAATWKYTLAGDSMTVSVMGTSLGLQRVR